MSGRRGHRLGQTAGKVITTLLLIMVLANGSVPPVWAGLAGYALQFDGVNDNVVLGPTQALLPDGWKDTLTVSLWVKPTGEAPLCSAPIPAHCGNIFGDKPRWWGIARGVRGGEDRLWVFAVDAQSSARWIGVTYTPGDWVHISLVHGEGRLRAYKFGVEVGNIETGTFQQPGQPGANPILYLGMISNNTHVWPFAGEIDEVSVWQTARTPAEVQADMYRTLTGDEPGLWLYYAMSDGTGTTLTEDGGSGADGTLNDGGQGVATNGSLPLWVESTAFETPPPAPIHYLFLPLVQKP